MDLRQDARGDGSGEEGQHAAHLPGHALPVRPLLRKRVLIRLSGELLPPGDVRSNDVLLNDVPVSLLDVLPHYC